MKKTHLRQMMVEIDGRRTKEIERRKSSEANQMERKKEIDRRHKNKIEGRRNWRSISARISNIKKGRLEFFKK